MLRKHISYDKLCAVGRSFMFFLFRQCLRHKFPEHTDVMNSHHFTDDWKPFFQTAVSKEQQFDDMITNCCHNPNFIKDS